MINLIIWWVGVAVIFLSSFCLTLFVFSILIQATLNYLWRKIKLVGGMSEIQKAWAFYQKHKELTDD